MSVQVRPARDAEEVRRAGEVAEAAYVADDLAPEHYRLRLRDAQTRARDAVLLVAVDEGGEVVGTVTYVAPTSPYAEICRPDEAEVRMLGVLPDARGQRVAESLVVACAERARADGLRALALSTRPEMVAAARVYERLGFVRVRERDWSPVPEVWLLGMLLEL